MDNDSVLHPACLPLDCLLAACELRPVRRSGPGGQHRNKVQSGIVLTHPPTGVLAEANERRSQADNRRIAIQRLRVNLALAIRSTTARPPVPSPLWQRRTRGGRIAVNIEHEDFPALLAEALDTIHNQDWDIKSSASLLTCSTSQLLKLLRQEPRAFQLVNDRRHQAGLHRLK